MPVITLSSRKLTEEQKRQLSGEFSAAASRITGVEQDAFYVIFNEYETDSFAVGDKLLKDRDRLKEEKQ